MRYDDIKPLADGWCLWQRPHHSRYRLACCDCQLVHKMQFRIVGKAVEFRVKRDERSTAGMRRKRKKIK